MGSRRRQLLSFGLSLAIHAGLALLAFIAVPVGLRWERAHQRPKPIEVEILNMSRSRPAKQATVAAVPPKAVPSRHEWQGKVPPRSPAKPEIPAPSTPASPVPESGGSIELTPIFTEKEAAPLPDLRASVEHLKPRGEAPSGSPWGGVTIHNGPGAEPDRETMLAESKRKAEEMIQGTIAETREIQAHKRVDLGIVDDYFRSLRHQLEKSASHPQPFDKPSFLKDVGESLAKNWTSSASNYGKTGNPYPDQVAPLYPPTALGDPSVLGPQNTGGMPAPGVASFQFVAESGAALKALVELRQAQDGKLLATILIKSSGNAEFDAHVIRAAPDALKDLPPPPPDGEGIHATGIRSLWAFEGSISYRKSAKDVGSGDWASVAAAAIPSLLGGMPFDETTGDVYVLDPAHPDFVVKVKLIAVY
jgi:hypothetical protein